LTQYLFSAFVDVSGSVLTPGPGLILSPGAAAAAFPDVGFDGSEYFVVWDDGRNANPNNPKDIYGQCLKHNGQGGGAIRYAQSAALSVASEAQEKPNITFDPFSKQFLLTWTDGRKPPLGMTDIFGVTVQHCDPIGWWFDVTMAPEHQRFPASASNRAGTFVTIWEDNRSWPQTGTDVFGKWLNTKGAHLTGDRKVAR
jgi:hypothetical protein